MFFHTLVNNLVKSGNKERAHKYIRSVLLRLKLELKTNPLQLCAKKIKSCETRLELKLSNLMRFQKKKEGAEVKIRGRLTHVEKLRAQRRAIKDLVKSAYARIDIKLADKLFSEVSDMCLMKGLTIKKKKDFYGLIRKIRPSVEIVKRKKRRKKINRL